MDRRTFILLTTLSAFASAACQPGQQTAASTDGFQAVGDLSNLQNPGDSVTVTVANKPAAVVRDPGSGNLTAVSRVCTHAGCSVEWRRGDQKFACPCHGAEFSASGAVLKGPAARPLETYPVKVEGNAVLVQGS